MSISKNWCVHYRGLMGPMARTIETCEAGVRYDDVKGEPDGKPLPYPCFRDHANLPCLKREWPSDEQLAEQERRTQESIKHFNDSLANDQCPHCGTPIEVWHQVGRCVYAAPCNHRLYQGTVPEGKKVSRWSK